MRTKACFTDLGARVEFGAFFHNSGEHIVTRRVSLVFKVRENRTLQRLGGIFGNDAIQR